MKRPLRYRTMGAVREGRGNPSPYSILCYRVENGIRIFGKRRCLIGSYLNLAA